MNAFILFKIMGDPAAKPGVFSMGVTQFVSQDGKNFSVDFETMEMNTKDLPSGEVVIEVSRSGRDVSMFESDNLENGVPDDLITSGYIAKSKILDISYECSESCDPDDDSKPIHIELISYIIYDDDKTNFDMVPQSEILRYNTLSDIRKKVREIVNAAPSELDDDKLIKIVYGMVKNGTVTKFQAEFNSNKLFDIAQHSYDEVKGNIHLACLRKGFTKHVVLEKNLLYSSTELKTGDVFIDYGYGRGMRGIRTLRFSK